MDEILLTDEDLGLVDYNAPLRSENEEDAIDRGIYRAIVGESIVEKPLTEGPREGPIRLPIEIQNEIIAAVLPVIKKRLLSENRRTDLITEEKEKEVREYESRTKSTRAEYIALDNKTRKLKSKVEALEAYCRNLTSIIEFEEKKEDIAPPRVLQSVSTEKIAIEPTLKKQGIYFLCMGETVNYVGQSIDVNSRITQHLRDPKKHFDNVWFVPVKEETDFDGIEAYYIHAFDPPHNRKIPDASVVVPPSDEHKVHPVNSKQTHIVRTKNVSGGGTYDMKIERYAEW